jgi:thiol-disulfide isomerase/thioredoxin
MKLLCSFILVILFFSCSTETKTNIDKTPEQIVLISKNAPKNYIHILKQDSLGKKLKDSSGRKMIFDKKGFTYLDYENNVKNWLPKANSIDTLVIPYYRSHMELTANNPYALMEEAFIIKNGDTVIFEYKHKIPQATITNRKVNDTALNYNKYRLKTLFNNKYTSHRLVFSNLFIESDFKNYKKNSLKYYHQALKDKELELQALDTLFKEHVISEIDFYHRKTAINLLIEEHRELRYIKKWNDNSFLKNENIQTQVQFDLSKTDSLMMFSFFRKHLSAISKYSLSLIREKRKGSGAAYIDSRIRFDSIVKDKRFNQTAKNYLLFEAYKGIGQNFSVKDKKRYFEKLQKETTNINQLKELSKKYNLNFKQSDKLLLTSLKAKDTITFKRVLELNKGKWLYVDFWASWCAPCRKAMPYSRKLKEAFKENNVAFIYVALNDKKENWKKAIHADSIQQAQHYFIENSNTSKVIEDLFIKTIPHYIIYNPKGEIVNGHAKRPGKGAEKQLNSYINKK